MKSYFYQICILSSLLLGGCFFNSNISWGPTSAPPSPKPDEGKSSIESPKGFRGLCIRVTSPKTIKSKDTTASYLTFLSNDKICFDAFVAGEFSYDWTIIENDGMDRETNPTTGVSKEMEYTPAGIDTFEYSIYRTKQPFKIMLSLKGTDSRDFQNGSVALYLIQDNVDDLRQEYYDVYKKRNVEDGVAPERSEIDNYVPENPELLGGNICPRHRWHIVRKIDERCTELKRLFEANNKVVTVTCGYRCPVGNANLPYHPGALKSEHMSGEAMDWDCVSGKTEKQNSQIDLPPLNRTSI